MSNTFKTNNQRQRHQLLRAGNKTLRQAGMAAAIPLFEAAQEIRCQLRYGNKRAVEAAMKVKQRRLDRRAEQRQANRRIQDDLRPDALSF